MATSGFAKQKEGWPFFFALLGLGFGTLWNAAGGSIEAFPYLGSVVVNESAIILDDPSLFFEKLIRLPEKVKIPPQRIVPPPELALAKVAAEKTVQSRPPLALLGGAGKPNPFFPKWVETLVREIEPPTVTPGGIADVGPRGPATPGGPNVQEDQYIFHGVVKIKEDPPFAVLRDVNKQVSVFMKEGDRYGPIQALRVEVSGATFLISGKEQQSFDTLHHTNKTITIRRVAGGS